MRSKKHVLEMDSIREGGEKHHIGDYLPKEALNKFNSKLSVTRHRISNVIFVRVNLMTVTRSAQV